MTARFTSILPFVVFFRNEIHTQSHFVADNVGDRVVMFFASHHLPRPLQDNDTKGASSR